MLKRPSSVSGATAIGASSGVAWGMRSSSGATTALAETATASASAVVIPGASSCAASSMRTSAGSAVVTAAASALLTVDASSDCPVGDGEAGKVVPSAVTAASTAGHDMSCAMVAAAASMASAS